MADVIANTVGTALDSISDNIADLILGTKTWKEAITDIEQAIISEVMSSIMQMVV